MLFQLLAVFGLSHAWIGHNVTSCNDSACAEGCETSFADRDIDDCDELKELGTRFFGNASWDFGMCAKQDPAQIPDWYRGSYPYQEWSCEGCVWVNHVNDNSGLMDCECVKANDACFSPGDCVEEPACGFWITGLRRIIDADATCEMVENAGYDCEGAKTVCDLGIGRLDNTDMLNCQRDEELCYKTNACKVHDHCCGLRTEAIIGIVVGAVVLCGVLVACFIVMRRRKLASEIATDQAEGKPTEEQATTTM